MDVFCFELSKLFVNSGATDIVLVRVTVHCAIAVSTAVLDRVTKTMSVSLLLTNNLDNSKQKRSNLLSPAPPPYSYLFWANLRVQLHLPPLHSSGAV